MAIELNQNDVNRIEKKLEKMDLNPNSLSPLEIFAKISKEQKEIEDKEREQAWCNSFLKIYTEIQSNDRRGKVVEIFINQICESTNIKSYINGNKTKKKGGGNGDGIILDKNVEIKASFQGKKKSFQHDLGETPWKANYMIFLDVSKLFMYLTIFKNLTEKQYKSYEKCEHIFQDKKITRRKGIGAFKLDTSISLNEKNIVDNHTFKIDNQTNIEELSKFILSKIK